MLTRSGKMPASDVSVVIPFRNRYEVLRRAIESVINQTVPVREIILVDDGSNDGADYEGLLALDSRIALVRHPKNLGGSMARNTGFDNASGKWIALLDSDDAWLPQKIETQMLLAEKTGNESVIIASNVMADNLDSPPKAHNQINFSNVKSVSEYLLVNDCALQTSTLIISSNLIKNIRFRENLQKHQDFDFLIMAESAGVDIIYTHEPLSIYYIDKDPQRITLMRNSPKHTVDWFKLVRKHVPHRHMQRYFVHASLGNAGLVYPMDTLKALMWMLSTSPDAFIYMTQLLAGKLNRRRKTNEGRLGKSATQ